MKRKESRLESDPQAAASALVHAILFEKLSHSAT